MAGVVLLGGPAWAQEDPCAPGADGSVPEMCQGGAAPEPVTEPGTDPIDPCLGSRPVEPGDGVVTDGGEPDEGIAVGEPHPDAPVEGEAEPGAEGEPKPEPVEEAPTLGAPAPDTGEDGVVCAYAGAPVSAPVDSSAGG